MASWDKVKGKARDTAATIREMPVLQSGAFPSELIDDRDTDQVPVDDRAFDEAEDTRTEQPHFSATVDDTSAQDVSAFDDGADEGDEPSVTGQGGDPPIGDDEFGGWDPQDVDEFWMRVHAIEAAGNESDEALDAALRKYGLRDKAHFDEVRDRFGQEHGHDPEAFAQAALDARTRATKQQMNARMSGELKGELAPFDGISLEQWAWLMAKIASGGNPAELLALAKIDDAKWQRVSAEWNARMSRDQTATIATAYGQAFVATGPGPFGESGKQTAKAMLDPSKRGVDGGPPIPMERWIEITEAQNAGSQHGEAAADILAGYGMTPADWGVVGGWWSQHFNANAMKLIGEYNRLSEHYRKKFAR